MPFCPLDGDGKENCDFDENGVARNSKRTVDLRHLAATGGFFPKVRFQVVDGFAYLEARGGAPIVVRHRLQDGPGDGNSTDLASIPPFLWGVIASYGLHTMPAIVHDQLCEAAKKPAHLRERLAARRHADRIFRLALRETRVPWVKRWLMWAAVRLFGVVTSTWVLGVILIFAVMALGAGLYALWKPAGWVPESWPIDERWLLPVIAGLAIVAFAALWSDLGRAVLILAASLPLVFLVVTANVGALVVMWIPAFLTWLVEKAAAWFGAPDPGRIPSFGPTRV